MRNSEQVTGSIKLAYTFIDDGDGESAPALEHNITKVLSWDSDANALVDGVEDFMRLIGFHPETIDRVLRSGDEIGHLQSQVNDLELENEELQATIADLRNIITLFEEKQNAMTPAKKSK